jgi:hypothetical protein
MARRQSSGIVSLDNIPKDQSRAWLNGNPIGRPLSSDPDADDRRLVAFTGSLGPSTQPGQQFRVTHRGRRRAFHGQEPALDLPQPDPCRRD